MSLADKDTYARQAAVLDALKHRKALEPLLENICYRARQRFDVPAAMVNLINESHQVTIAGSGPVLDVVPRRVGFCDIAIRSDAVLVVENAAKHPLFHDNPLVTGPPYIRFYAGVPLLFIREIRLGVFCVCGQKPRSFSLGDIAELEELADQVISRISDAQFPPL